MIDGILPDGWTRVRLGDLAQSSLGKMLDNGKNKGTPQPYLRNVNVRWRSFDLSDVQEMRFESSEAERFGLRSGDVLVCEGGEPGRAAVWRQEASEVRFQKALHRVRCGPALDPDWLVCNLEMAANTGSLSQHFTGSGISHFTGVALSEFPIVTPPIAEQRRIVAKLDDLRARSRRAREALSNVPAMLDQLKQSILAAAFRGELTSSWRAANPDVEPASVALDRVHQGHVVWWTASGCKKKWSPPKRIDSTNTELAALPDGWSWAQACEIVTPGTIMTYGIVLPGEHVPDGVPYVRGGDIEGGRILADQLLRTTHAIAATKPDSELAEGDVLLCIIRHLKVAIVPAGLDGANLTQGTVRLRCSDAVSNRFLAYWLASPFAQEWLKGHHFGLAMPRINVEDARVVPVPVPPRPEQDAILAILDATMGRMDQVRSEVDQQRKDVEHLDESMLAKAFRGELVPQDPSDEPAEALLARIRADHAEPARPARRGRTATIDAAR